MTQRPCAIVSFLLGFAATSLAAGQTTAPAAARTKITVSRETTVLTGPLNPDGTVNYLAAINAMRAQGVTPQNNAAILLLSALGPEMLPEQTRANALRQLDMPPLPAKGSYFVGLEAFAASQVRQSQTDDADLLDKAMSSPWSAADLPITDGWLKANQKPLALAVAASKLPRYYVPLITEKDPPVLAEVRGLPYAPGSAAAPMSAARRAFQN